MKNLKFYFGNLCSRFHLVTLISALLLLPAAAHACRCAQQDLTDYYGNADVVLKARVVAVIDQESAQLGNHVTAQLQLLESFKGGADISTINTRGSSTACGLDFQAGQEYVLFANLEIANGLLWANTCNGSRLSDDDFQDVSADQVLSKLQSLASANSNNEVLTRPFIRPACWSEARNYHVTVPLEIWNKISISRAPWTQQHREAQQENGLTSPNAAYSFSIDNPSAIQRPPRIAVIAVDNERDYQLRISLHGLISPIEPHWVNEKLLQVQVEWSTELASDIIFDVENEEFVYHEAVLSGAELWPAADPSCE